MISFSQNPFRHQGNQIFLVQNTNNIRLGKGNTKIIIEDDAITPVSDRKEERDSVNEARAISLPPSRDRTPLSSAPPSPRKDKTPQHSAPPSPKRERASSLRGTPMHSAPSSPRRSAPPSPRRSAPPSPRPQVTASLSNDGDERRRKVVDFSPMVSLSVALPFESDEEDNIEEAEGEAPVLLISSVPEGMPVPLTTLKSLANHPLDPGRNKITKTLEGRVTFNSEEDEWNEKYQKLVDSETMTFEQSLVQGMGISSLVGSFVAASKKYAKIIIDEYHIPDAQKSIPPIPMGPDIPDSEKDEIYIQSGILFRFAVDPSGKLDEETSYRIANHELKGAKAYIETNIQGIHITLSCVVDYKGFRMLSVAFFPADGEQTLFYALTSTVLRMDETVKKLLLMAKPKLNLKERIFNNFLFS